MSVCVCERERKKERAGEIETDKERQERASISWRSFWKRACTENDDFGVNDFGKFGTKNR